MWTWLTQRYYSELVRCVLEHVNSCLLMFRLYSRELSSFLRTSPWVTSVLLARWCWFRSAFSAWIAQISASLQDLLWPAFSPWALTWASLSEGLSVLDHVLHSAYLSSLVRAVWPQCYSDQWSVAPALTLYSLSCRVTVYSHWVLAKVYESSVVFLLLSVVSFLNRLPQQALPRNLLALAFLLNVVRLRKPLSLQIQLGLLVLESLAWMLLEQWALSLVN